MKSIHGIDGPAAVKRAEELLSQYEEEEEFYVNNGEYLPLGVWAARGFDTKAIEEFTDEKDRRIHAVLGPVYRVKILSTGQRGCKGQRRSSNMTALQPAAQAAKKATGSLGDIAGLSVQEAASSSEDESESSSSSSTSSPKRKSKKGKKGKKSKKDKKNKGKKGKKDKKEKKEKKGKPETAAERRLREKKEKADQAAQQKACAERLKLAQLMINKFSGSFPNLVGGFLALVLYGCCFLKFAHVFILVYPSLAYTYVYIYTMLWSGRSRCQDRSAKPYRQATVHACPGHHRRTGGGDGQAIDRHGARVHCGALECRSGNIVRGRSQELDAHLGRYEKGDRFALAGHRDHRQGNLKGWPTRGFCAARATSAWGRAFSSPLWAQGRRSHPRVHRGPRVIL